MAPELADLDLGHLTLRNLPPPSLVCFTLFRVEFVLIFFAVYQRHCFP